MRSGTDHRDGVPAVRLGVRTRASVAGAAVLMVAAVGLTVAADRHGDSVSRPLLLLWTYALGAAGLAAWCVHRERLAADPHFYERRRLDERAERIHRLGGIATTLLVLLLVPRDLAGPERWAVPIAVGVVAGLSLQLLVRRRDPRARLWGRPRPLTDEELVQRRA